VTDAATLSALQEGLWFAYEADRANPTNHVTFAARVSGPVDTPALKRAWAALCMRHEALRTTFHGTPEGVRRRVEPKCTAELQEVPASSWAEDRLRTSVADRHRRPMDLSRSAARAFLYRTAQGGVLLLTTHMIVADPGAYDALLDDFGALYAAELAKAPAQLPPPATGEPPLADADAEFWEAYLGQIDRTDLATDRDTRPASRSARAVSATFRVDAATLGALHDDRSCALLAAFGVMLDRFRRVPGAGVFAPAIGLLVDARDAEHRNVVGAFANLLPVRVQTDRAQSARALVAAVHDSVSAAQPHAAVPFASVVRALRVRSTEAPIAQAAATFFSPKGRKHAALAGAFVSGAEWRGALGPLAVEAFPLSQQETLLPVQLRAVTHEDGSVAGELLADADLFDAWTVETMRDALVAVLRDVAARPDAPLAGVGLAPPVQPAPAAPASARPLPPRLSELAAGNGAATAVLGEAEGLTRAALQAAAGRLAATMRGKGASVAVRAARGDHALVALLAAWQAGASCTLVDRTWDDARATAAAATAALTVGDADVDGALAGGHVGGTPGETDAAAPALIVFPRVDAGAPSGVTLSQAELAARAAVVAEALSVGEADVVSVSPWSDTIATLAALVSGACLAPRTGHAVHPKATVIVASASEWAAILASGWRAEGSPRAVCVGAATSELLEQIATAGARVATALGTRDLGWIAHGTQPDGGERSAIRRQVGRPTAGASLQIVDGDGAALPAGLTGTLRLGDRDLGLAARWLGDGVLDVLGRVDGAFEAGGALVSGAAVEAAARQAMGVADAALVARTELAFGTGRALFVETTTAGESDVRAALEQRLPADALPHAIVLVDKLPRTASSAVDLARLATQALRSASAQRGAGGVEDTLAAIWAEVLGVPTVGMDEDFFDLGGHSLLATKIVAKIRDVLGVDVPLRTIFDAPTVAQLADRIRKMGGSEKVVVEAPPALRRGAGPTTATPSFVQEAIASWEAQRKPSGTWTAEIAVRLVGRLDVGALREALAALFARHEVLLTTFRGREYLAVDASRVPLEEIPTAAGDVDAFCAAEADRPFACDGSPLVRAFLLVSGPEDHTFVLAHHQLVHDPTTGHHLAEDLLELYAARVEKRAPRLPELPVRYVDYAAWEREWFDGGGKAEIERARALIEGAKPLDLAEKPRTGPVSPAAVGHWFEVDAASSARFEATCKASSATLYMGFAAVVAVMLHRWGGAEDVVFMSPANMRNRRAETQRVAGRFLNWIPLRLSLAGDPTFKMLMQRARSAVLDAQSVEWAPASRVYGTDDVLGHPLNRALLNTPYIGGSLEAKASAPGLQATIRIVEGRSGARNDLAFVLKTPGGILSGGIRGAADLFSVETIRRQAGELQRIVQAVTPDKKLSEI
jgi:non-ribosomal peptide synthetase component F/acyl carrier protein